MPDPTLAGGGRDTVETADGNFTVAANQVTVVTIPALPPEIPDTSSVSILAAGLVPTDGFVYVRGYAGVRITSGPPPLPETSSSSTNGVEIMVGEIQNVTLKRGLLDGVDQKIEMTPSGITVDAGAMPVTIQSLTQITLSVAGGLSTITLGPQGITIQGILVQIN